MTLMAFVYLVMGIVTVLLFNEMEEFTEINHGKKVLIRFLTLILWPIVFIVGAVISFKKIMFKD
jgi:predicted membrane channel-forming protein YqfA (hemolysin III family)